MKKFELPEIWVEQFSVEDIVTLSVDPEPAPCEDVTPFEPF